MNTIAPNGHYHSVTNVSDESSYRDSLAVLPGIGYLDDLHVVDEVSYKNEEGLSYASNDNQESNADILMDADYHSDPLSISLSKLFQKYQTLMTNISSVADHYHLVTSSRFSFTLIVT
ncbi:unnamed protein product [Schistosoma mattheei]|uniref:Uncharacterized protein n=1 Tax=Schistosoma mattheei TaxID=31246 RepID=A0A183PTP5_9TREM|nr:unnamed protein product [Schistosoma mattheei]